MVFILAENFSIFHKSVLSRDENIISLLPPLYPLFLSRSVTHFRALSSMNMPSIVKYCNYIIVVDLLL